MRTIPTSLLRVLAFLVLCSPGTSRAQSNWPNFRGPTGQGIAPAAAAVPTTWSEKENVKWKTTLRGKSWSSPVIWGNQVWMTSATENGTELFVICVDKNTGKPVYDFKLFDDPAANPTFQKYNSYASPTPAIEEGRVYVTFGSAGTAAIDTATGKPVWTRRDINVNHYRGAGSSILLYKDLLVIPFDGVDKQFILALDKKTGQTVWKTPRSVDYEDLDPKTGQPKTDGDFRKGFSTPRLLTVNGRDAILSESSKATYAYEPETGKEIWRLEHKGQHSGSSTPVIGDGLVFICTGFGKGDLWAFKPDGRGVLGNGSVVWKRTNNIPCKGSTLLVGDLLYYTDDNGMASCVEAATGKEVWKQRLKGNFSAAPLYAGGHIYFFGENGITTVIKPGREFTLVAENKLDDGCRATAAVSDNALYVRTTAQATTQLYRIEN